MMPMPPPRTTPLTADEIERIERDAATFRSLAANATDPALRAICGALAGLLDNRTTARKE